MVDTNFVIFLFLDAKKDSRTGKLQMAVTLKQKVGVFIDAENIEASGYKIYQGRTDYKKLLDLVRERDVARIIYYKPKYKEITLEFEDFWTTQGGEIKQPDKNADCFLIIDIVTMADKLDVVVIMAGDKDYVPLVWYLKSKGCKVEIWAYPESSANDLISAADTYFPLDEAFIIPEKSRKNTSRRKR